MVKKSFHVCPCPAPPPPPGVTFHTLRRTEFHKRWCRSLVKRHAATKPGGDHQTTKKVAKRTRTPPQAHATHTTDTPHTSTRTHPHTRARARSRAHTCTHTRAHVHTHVHTHARTRTHVHTRAHAHVHVHTRAHTLPHTDLGPRRNAAQSLPPPQETGGGLSDFGLRRPQSMQCRFHRLRVRRRQLRRGWEAAGAPIRPFHACSCGGPVPRSRAAKGLWPSQPLGRGCTAHSHSPAWSVAIPSLEGDGLSRAQKPKNKNKRSLTGRPRHVLRSRRRFRRFPSVSSVSVGFVGFRKLPF